MVSTQTNFSICTDSKSSQSLTQITENHQPELLILSSTTTSKKKKPIKQIRRKKLSKNDDNTPVTINPQIARTATGVTFTTAPPIHSSILSTMGHFVGPFRGTTNEPMPLGFFLPPSTTTGNLNSSQSSYPPQSISSWTQASLPSHYIKWNGPPMNSNTSSTWTSSEYENIANSFSSPNRELLSTPSSLPIVKQKSKKAKKLRLPLVDHPQQEHSSPYHHIIPIPTCSTCLPLRTSSSVVATNNSNYISPTNEQNNIPVDMTLTSSGTLSQPVSILNSVKSPPCSSSSSIIIQTNQNNNSTSSPIQQQQQHLSTHMINTNGFKMDKTTLTTQFFQNHDFTTIQIPRNNSPMRNSPSIVYPLRTTTTTPHQQYSIVSSNPSPKTLSPMIYSSILPEPVPVTVTPLPSLADINKISKTCTPRKPKVVMISTVEMPVDEQNKRIPISSIRTPSVSKKKRKRRKSITADPRTRTLWQRIKRQNRSAVLNFMVQKQKKQQRLSNTKLTNLVSEEKTIQQSVDTSTTIPVDVESKLADVIASSLKIRFDSTQNIESISLSYYRRRQSAMVSNKQSISPLYNADNKLCLLLEAAELMETMHHGENGNKCIPANRT